MSGEAPQSRPMKYPYTLTAKVAQFPVKFHLKHSWQFKYWLIAVVVCAPVFYKIQKLSYAPANVERWKKIREKQFSGEREH